MCVVGVCLYISKSECTNKCESLGFCDIQTGEMGKKNPSVFMSSSLDVKTTIKLFDQCQITCCCYLPSVVMSELFMAHMAIKCSIYKHSLLTKR